MAGSAICAGTADHASVSSASHPPGHDRYSRGKIPQPGAGSRTIPEYRRHRCRPRAGSAPTPPRAGPPRIEVSTVVTAGSCSWRRRSRVAASARAGMEPLAGTRFQRGSRHPGIRGQGWGIPIAAMTYRSLHGPGSPMLGEREIRMDSDGNGPIRRGRRNIPRTRHGAPGSAPLRMVEHGRVGRPRDREDPAGGIERATP
jgi:hypothetical protein